MRAKHQFLGLVVCERYRKAMGAIPGYGRFGSTSIPDPDPDSDSEKETELETHSFISGAYIPGRDWYF